MTRRIDWTLTLDDAKHFRGRWLRINDTTQACLDWTYEEGWVLTFRSNATLEIISKVYYHKSQSVEGVSWPGTWPLAELEDPRPWRERTLPRKSTEPVLAWAWP